MDSKAFAKLGSLGCVAALAAGCASAAAPEGITDTVSVEPIGASEAARPDEPGTAPGSSVPALRPQATQDVARMVRRPDGAFDVQCSNGAIEVATDAQILADRVCLQAGGIQCTPRCESRYQNGQCARFGADYCDRGSVACLPYCSARYQNGQCARYGADACGTGQVQCAPQCTARYPNGQCAQYGADACVVSPAAITCVPQCTARYQNGQCARYGADACATGAVNCVAVCGSRYQNGQCAQYTGDLCGRNVQACAPQCTTRYMNGQCATYGADYCGAPRSLAASLTGVAALVRQGSRFEATCFDGSVDSVSLEELMTEGACVRHGTPSCIARCVSRYQNGQCARYGSDFCGEGTLQCVPQCTSRYPNGQCSGYGPDLCASLGTVVTPP